MSITVQRIVIPTVLVLLLGALVFAAVRRPETAPLLPEGKPPRLVILLTPSLSVSDLRDNEAAPALATAAKSGMVGVTPALRPRIRPGRYLPDDSCQNQEWPVAFGRENLVFALPVDDNTAADGERTDTDVLTNGILRGVRNTPATPIVAVFDDLCRNDRYAPLAMTEVTHSERGYALKRLDDTVARLIGPGGLPPETLLLIVSAAPATGEAICPIIVWRRGGDRFGLLTSPTTHFTPGLVTRNDLTATVAALLGQPAPNRTGHPITLFRDLHGLERLTDLAGVWSFRAWNVASADGIVWVLLPIAVLGVGCYFGSRGQIGILRTACLFLAVLLLGDILLGGNLLARTPLAWGVFSGERLFGIGSAASGLLVASALLGSTALGGGLPLVLWGIIVVGTLLTPTLGADTGGGLAALLGFAVMAAIHAFNASAEAEEPSSSGRGRVLLILSAAAIMACSIVAYWLLQNGIAGFLAARALRLLFAHPFWATLLLIEGASTYYLWSRPDAGMHQEEYAALVGVFAATVIFLLADNTPLLGAASCLLCALPPLLVANSRYWTQPADGEANTEGDGE